MLGYTLPGAAIPLGRRPRSLPQDVQLKATAQGVLGVSLGRSVGSGLGVWPVVRLRSGGGPVLQLMLPDVHSGRFDDR